MSGRDDAWSQVSTLVAGPVAWGAIGFGVDRLTGLSLFVPIGITVGFVAAMWLVFLRYTQAVNTHSTSEEKP